ncbi:MAG TPA: hypothetical protein VI488_21820 [Candidatus Angelobacter sp.]
MLYKHYALSDRWRGRVKVIGNPKREINVGAPILTLGAMFIFVIGLILSFFQLGSLAVTEFVEGVRVAASGRLTFGSWVDDGQTGSNPSEQQTGWPDA